MAFAASIRRLFCREETIGLALSGKTVRAACGPTALWASPLQKNEERGRDKSRPYKVSKVQVPKRAAARAFALAASSSRFFGGALVSSERRSRPEMAATSSMAAWKAASLALDGLLKPVIFRTNCSEAARTSSGVTGGSKLKSVLIFRHMVWGPPWSRAKKNVSSGAKAHLMR